MVAGITGLPCCSILYTYVVRHFYKCWYRVKSSEASLNLHHEHSLWSNLSSCICQTQNSIRIKPQIFDRTHTHTHTHPFNGPVSGTTQVSRYQKGNTNLDFCEARDSEWQWHQLGRMQVCTSLQTDNHASTPLLSFFTGRMPFLPPNQQRQSTEGIKALYK